MIVFSVSVCVPPLQRADFLKSVGALLEPTRVVPGCVNCRLYLDVEDPDAFTLVEEWVTQAALDRHLTSSAFKTLVAAIEMSAEPPAVHIDSVAQRAGIELVEAARRRQGLL
ncbi:putative quinol monooxygenase [Thiocapsa sp.]|uniref:putative quinol monooxygenase n=1 Tax=Thiocapsa sp. TaxID=2024551 RepID=UPI002C2ABE4A|nr:putative quinol monooxygenase [Thiocapsa sp.]HSO81518.1 putative quinol monooxygenase [Thiocapsa sp.]